MLDVEVLNPQRVAKQALVSIVATAQPGFTTRYPQLRALLVNREASAPIAPIRLWLYLKADPSATTTGLVAALDIERVRGHLVAGFSFCPLGWIVTIGDAEVKGAVDVSAWTELAYMDRGPFPVQILASGPLPLPGGLRRPGRISSTPGRSNARRECLNSTRGSTGSSRVCVSTLCRCCSGNGPIRGGPHT